MILKSSGAMRFIRLLFVFALLSMPDPMPADAQHCIIRDFGEDDGLAHWHVTSMLQDSYGILWFGTWNGLERFDGETFTLFKSHPGDQSVMPNDRIRDIKLGRDNCIYCYNENEWYRFNPTTGTFSTVGQTMQRALDLQPHQMNTSLWKRYPITREMKGLNFSMADRQGNIWLIIPTGIRQVSFKPSTFRRLWTQRNAEVKCIYQDRTGHIWISTKEDSKVRIYDHNLRLIGYLTPEGHITTNPTSFVQPVYSILQDHKGTIWLGSKPGGLFKLQKSNTGFAITRYVKGTQRNSLNCNNIYDIAEGPDGRLWLATMGGGINIMTSRKGNAVFLNKDNGLKGWPKAMRANCVRRLLFSPLGELYAATTEGLITYKKGGEFILHAKEPDRQTSLSCNATMDVAMYGGNHVYVSTESGGVNEAGVANLGSGQLLFRHYNSMNGLNSDITQGMVIQGQTLWVASSNQVLTLDMRRKRTASFGTNFWGEPLRFSEARPLRLADGQWLFGLLDGAITVNERQFARKSYVPPIYLTNISIKNQPNDYNVNHLDTLVLNPNERSLTINFKAIDYTPNANIRYATRLDKDSAWLYLDHIHAASFLDMQPGTYQLHIKSTNAHGEWSDNERVLTIVVKPRFTETLWFKILLALIIAALTATGCYTYFYIRRIRRKQSATLKAYLDLLNKQQDRTHVHQRTERPNNSLSPEDERFMAKVMAYVERELGNSDANLNDMAAATATSLSGLNRKMKSIVGLTPAEFLFEARIKKACTLLSTTEAPISDISWQCGFTDPKYFSKRFKASKGLSPTEYRASEKE